MIVAQDAAQFADAIDSFRDGRRDAAAMGVSGRDWTLGNLSTEEVSSRFEELYGSCVGQAR